MYLPLGGVPERLQFDEQTRLITRLTYTALEKANAYANYTCAFVLQIGKINSSGIITFTYIILIICTWTNKAKVWS
jgi:hypothetical protein